MDFPADCDFVCLYGWDLYREALLWVDDTRRVAIVSEEERESSDPRIKVYALESPLQLDLIAKKIAWSAVLKKMVVLAPSPFKERVEEVHLAAHLILSEAADYRVGALKNARVNGGAFRSGLDLKGAFAKVPALIVGAGPSLEKNRRLLADFEERALIFAGGSALNAIENEPHFAGSIDGAAPYRQFKMHPFAETPFCYQARMNPENFSLVHGERLLFPDSSSDAINWIHEQESFDSGWTVGNFMTAVAAHWGCSPIIFVGMDLCYSQGRKYAQIEAPLQEGLATQRDWLMAARWTEARKETLINATEGGILSLPAMKLEEVLKNCKRIGPLREKVHEAIQRVEVREAKRWDDWEASLRKCQKNIANCEEEIVYKKLLMPLWQIWEPLFADQKQREVHQMIFFEQVLEEHLRD